MIFYGPKGRNWALVAPGGSPEEGTTHQGAQEARARLGAQTHPGGLCPLEAPPGASLDHMVSSGPKKISVKFRGVWTRLILIFYDVKDKQKIATGTWHWVNRLVPKNDIKFL